MMTNVSCFDLVGLDLIILGIAAAADGATEAGAEDRSFHFPATTLVFLSDDEVVVRFRDGRLGSSVRSDRRVVEVRSGDARGNERRRGFGQRRRRRNRRRGQALSKRDAIDTTALLRGI